MPYVPPVDTSPRRTQDYGLSEVGQASQSFGAQVGGLLRERLNKKQYDDFLAGPNKEFSSSLRQIGDLMMDESNPDGAAQGVRLLSSAMTTYMDAAAQFPENPLIAQRTKQVWDMNMQFMNQELVMRHNAAQAERQKGLDAVNAAKAAAEIQLQGAQTEEILSKAKRAKAKADAESAIQLWSGDPEQYQGLSSDDKTNQIWNNTVAAPQFLKNPTRLKAYQQAIADTRTQMAQEKLNDFSARGEMKDIRPAPGDPLGIATRQPWDPHSAADLKDIAQSIDTEEVKARWAMNAVRTEAYAHGMKPEDFDKFAVRVDPTKANAFTPLDRAVPETTLGKIMLGVGGWNQLFDTQTRTAPKNMQDAIPRLPPSIDKLSGPIAKVFRDLPIAAKDDNLQSVDDVAVALNKYGWKMALSIIAPGRDYASLNEGQKANLEQARQLVNAMAGKYAAEVASKMGITAPAARGVVRPPQKAPLTSGTVGDITAPLFRAISGGYGLIKPYLPEGESQPEGQ